MTSVQECSKLDTGVGPSIASGSQRKLRVMTDLNVSAKTNNHVLNVNVEKAVKVRNIMATSNKTSPTRLNPMAVYADARVSERCDQ